jgi:hypothetical protein
MNEKIRPQPRPVAPEFNKAANPTKSVINQNAPSTQGHGSGMVRESKIIPVPKPPAMGQHLTQDAFNKKWDKEAEDANRRNGQISRIPRKPVIDLKHQQEGARLREKFQKAASKESDRGR